MCYAKPGPRCSRHALENLKRANRAIKAAITADDCEAYFRAQDARRAAVAEYEHTPAGIRELRAEGNDYRANLNEQERRDQIAAYHAEQARIEQEQRARAALEEAGSDGVDQAILTLMREGKIDDHDFSRFHRFEGTSITRDADGAAVVTGHFYSEWDGDAYYSNLEGWMEPSTFADPATAEDELEEYRQTLIENAEWSDQATDGEYAMVRAGVDKVVPDYMQRVTIRTEVEQGVYVDEIKDTVDTILLQRVNRGDLDADDLNTIIRHPFATDETREAAREALADLED